MDKIIIYILSLFVLQTISCTLDNQSHISNNNTEYHNSDNQESNLKMCKIFQIAADSITANKRFNVCLNNFPKKVDGKITIICQVFLNQDLELHNKSLLIRFYEKWNNKRIGITGDVFTAPKQYKNLCISQNEFTDSILIRINNLSLLNCGRLAWFDDINMYTFTFVYYLEDCND